MNKNNKDADPNRDIILDGTKYYDVKIKKEDVLYGNSYDGYKKSSRKSAKKHNKSSREKNKSEYFKKSDGETIISKTFYQENLENLNSNKYNKYKKYSPTSSKKSSPTLNSKKGAFKSKSFESDSSDSGTSSSGSSNNGPDIGTYDEYIYPLGFFRLILRHYNNSPGLTGELGDPNPPDINGARLQDAEGQRMELALIDERLSLEVDKDNAGEVAKYFDTITMSPVEKISDMKDILEHVNVSKLNKDLETIRNILLSLPNLTALTSVLNQMHPAKFADLSLILFNNHSLLYSNIRRHFEEISYCATPCNNFNAWAKAFGNFQTMKTNGAQTGYHDHTGGVLVGADFFPREGLCVGAAFAYTYDDVKWHRKEADALIDSYYGLLYGSISSQRCFLEAMGSFSYSSIDGHRFIRASELLDRKASHDSHALTYAGRLSGGVNFDLPCDVTLQVFDAVDLGNVENKAFKEHGACALNLHVRKHHVLHVRNEVGIQLSRDFLSNCQTACWTPAVALKWIYQNPLSGRHGRASFQHQRSSFRIKARNQKTNQIAPEASVTVNSEDGLYLSAYYEGAFGDGWKSNEVGLHFGKSF